MLHRLRSLMNALFRRNRFESAMSEEIRFHIDAYADDLVRAGWSREEALRKARLDFGGVERIKEESRDARGIPVFHDLRADVRYAMRQLRQAPVFTAVAVLSLALGIGANTAIFSLMQSVLWSTLPVDATERLRLIAWVSGPQQVMDSTWGNMSPTPTGGRTSTSFSYPVLQQLQLRDSSFEQLFAFKPIGRITAVIDGQAELVTGQLVSGNAYKALGVVPIAGRPIIPADDDRPGSDIAVVISDAFWARRFAHAPAVLGRTMTLNQIPVTIVGVNPPAFTGLMSGQKPDVFLPLSAQPVVLPWRYGKSSSLLNDPEYWWVLMMGRLKPGVDEREATASLDVLLRQAVQATLPHKSSRDQPRIELLAGAQGLNDVRKAFSTQLFVLSAFVALVLLIACANLANLLLGRALVRQREIGLRLALGAGRGRVARQLFTEGIVLALLGGAMGILLGYWARDSIPYLLSTSWRASPLQADFDPRVLAMCLVVTLLTGVLFSLAPVWQSTRVELTQSLKDGARTTMTRSKRVMRRSLVVFQVALSVLLLTAAGLFVRTLWNLRSADLGFQPDQILLFTIDPPRSAYSGEARKVLFQRLEQEIGRLPGVVSASLSSEPLVANSSSTTRVAASGRKPSQGDSIQVWVNDVGERFFGTMGIPILYGRAFGPHDRATSLPVAVVNQQFVRTFFPGENPLGQTFANASQTWHIVGICADARYDEVSTPVPPTFYRPFAQAEDLGAMTFEVRAIGEAALVKSVREVVRAIDKDIPVFDVRTQEEQIADTFSYERLFAVLTSAFGLLALVLACIGIYGVMDSAVASRIPEIGIRMALGADNRRVLTMILRESAGVAGFGVVIGVLGAAALGRSIEGLLYGIRPFDPLTVGGAVLLMLVVALFAGWWPARFAATLDPMQALRQE
jgi:predicted permease